MTSPWNGRPGNWGRPGHVNKGDEGEEILDQLEYMSTGHPVRYKYTTQARSRSSANTGATYTDDPDLAIAVEANAVYEVSLRANLTIGAGSFKQQFTWPSGSAEAGDFDYANGTVSYTTTSNGWQKLVAAASSPGMSITGVAGGAHGGTPWRVEFTLFTGATAGNLVWQWAQDASNAANTTVEKGARLRVTRIDAIP